jgi:antitoxin VapB
MGVIETKTFKSGNSVALRLPKSLAIGPDEKMLIEQKGGVLTIRRAQDREEERRKVRELAAALAEIGVPDDGIQKRPDFIAPIRRGI